MLTFISKNFNLNIFFEALIIELWVLEFIPVFL
jgi:hypothetical protein